MRARAALIILTRARWDLITWSKFKVRPEWVDRWRSSPGFVQGGDAGRAREHYGSEW